MSRRKDEASRPLRYTEIPAKIKVLMASRDEIQGELDSIKDGRTISNKGNRKATLEATVKNLDFQIKKLKKRLKDEKPVSPVGQDINPI